MARAGRLGEDRVGDRDLADVAQQRRELDPLGLDLSAAEVLGDPAGHAGETRCPGTSTGLLRLDRAGEREDRRGVEPIVLAAAGRTPLRLSGEGAHGAHELARGRVLQDYGG